MAVGRRAHLLAALMMLALLVLAVVAPGSVAAQEKKPNLLDPSDPPPVPDRVSNGGLVPGRIIVKYEEGTNPAEEAAVRRQENLDKEEELGLIDAEVVEVEGRPTGAALRDLNSRPDVEYAELDYIYHPSGYTDEPRFGELWGLDNIGQTINGAPGTADVDVNAKEASAMTQGDPTLVVAVIDTGVDFSHPDLADRAWKNPGESGEGKETNGVDDDGNGYVDDVNGWDFFYDDKTVHDPGEDAHGTHVSGTIAASVNGQGVVGVAPNVQVMSLKFLGPQGGFTSDAIQAIEYARSKGVRISNNSWGGGAYSQALEDAIDDSGQLFVAAAGNSASNNDSNPRYPSSYDSPNILSVAAINNQGNLASFSNYGATSVDVSAPGVNILSSIPGGSDIPAAALSSVGSAGKAVTTGFGADEIGDGAKRASFMSKAFTAVNRGSEQVVLVDDDLSDAGNPDVGAALSAAIQSATGSAPQEIDVGANANGPDLSQLSGKTVVWATGLASSSGSAGTTLTPTDQQTLTDFLDRGGKLVLTGMDALWLIENSSFVTSTLNLRVQSDVGNSVNTRTFNGSSGTAFDGESYTFDSSTAYTPYHDKVMPAVSSTVIQGVYPSDTPPSWQYFNGTSMAAPHATGVAALAASKYPGLLSEPAGLKQVVMDTGKPVPSTAGKTVTGDMVDARAALLGVSNVSPPENAKDVAGSTNVTATFVSEMDPTTLNTSTFTLTRQDSTTPVDAAVSYVAATKTATLDPNADLETDNTTYTATIKGGPDGARDAAGNALAADKVWTFSTADTTAPQAPVISSPANDSFDSDGNFTVSGTAENGSTVELSEGASIVGRVTAGGSGNWSVPLGGVTQGEHTYTARAKDAANNTSGLSNPLKVTVDATAPRVDSTVPVSGAKDVARATNITATFSDRMDESTLTAQFIKLVNTATGKRVNNVAVSYDDATRTLTIDPFGSSATLLAKSTKYKVTIATGVTNVAGISLDQNPSALGNQPKTWTFTTGRR